MRPPGHVPPSPYWNPALGVAVVRMVLPTGTDTYDRLRSLSTQIRKVVAHEVWHGAAGALVVAYLYLFHRTDLSEVEPGFPAASEILDDVDACRLIAEFGGYAEAIVVVIDVERVIKDDLL